MTLLINQVKRLIYLNNKLYLYIFRAGKAPPGLHLDVVKEGKLFQVGQFSIDSKKQFVQLTHMNKSLFQLIFCDSIEWCKSVLNYPKESHSASWH